MPADATIRTLVASRIGYDFTQIELTTDPLYQVVDANFDLIVSSELEAYPWKWNRVEENFTPAAITDDVEEPYAGIIVLPDRVIRVEYCHQDGSNIKYERMGPRLQLYDYNTDYDVTVVLQNLCAVQTWPDLFKAAIVNRLCVFCSAVLQQRTSMANSYSQLADRELQRLRSWDSQQQPARRIVSARFAAHRRAASTSPRRPTGRTE